MIESIELGEPNRVEAFVTTRQDGRSRGPFSAFNLSFDVGDKPAAVAANRQTLVNQYPSVYEWSSIKQVHGIEVVQQPFVQDERPEADAVFTFEKHQVCSVMTADCLPILLTDSQGQFVAAIHAGWRSLAGGIIQQTMRAIEAEAAIRKLAIEPSECSAWLGPCISQSAFEVGQDVLSAFQVLLGEAASLRFRAAANGKYYADLAGLAEQLLNAQQVQKIARHGGCTYRDESLFFSYRRDKQTGRMLSGIVLA